MQPRWLRLIAVSFALGLLAAACGDSDEDDSSGATDTTSAPETTGGSDTTTAPDTTAAPSTEAPDTTGAAAGEGEGGVLDFVPLDVGGPLTKDALRAGDIDVALLFTTDAEIAAEEWVLLEDDQGLQQIENLIPAIRTDRLDDATAAALNAISAPLSTEELTELNRQVTLDLVPAAEVAQGWLEENGLLPYTGDAVEGEFTVGSTNFFEQEILAEMYAQVLESAGATVNRTFQLGAREVVAPALEAGEIDLYPEYIGSYAVFLGAETVPTDPTEAVAMINELANPKGVTVLDPAPAQDTNGFVVTQETADAYGLATVSDLATVPDVLVLGGPPECPERPFCAIGLTDVYGLTINT
jgi:glycine betaine/choline ABC-type transport system substrate-binding protein